MTCATARNMLARGVFAETTRIEVSDRAKVVVDHHSTGQTYLSIRIDGAAFGVMLSEADRRKLAKSLSPGG